jgi:hypothetical protein
VACIRRRRLSIHGCAAQIAFSLHSSTNLALTFAHSMFLTIGLNNCIERSFVSMHSFSMLALSLPHFVYHNKQSSASSSKLLAMLCLSSSCTFHVLPMIPFCRVVARGVPLYSVEWDSRIVCVERLELQLISKAGSESQLLTRRDSRS